MSVDCHHCGAEAVLLEGCVLPFACLIGIFEFVEDGFAEHSIAFAVDEDNLAAFLFHMVLHGDWTDGAANELSIFKMEDGLFFGTSIHACYASQAESTEVTSAAPITEANAAWEFIPVADAVAALEAGEATDATFLLKDASISRHLYHDSYEKVWQGDSFAKGGPNENMNAEKWGGNSQTFDAYQTISVPNGTYTVSVQGYYRYNNTADNTNEVAIAAHADGTEVIYSYLYANGKEVPFASIADDEAAAALEALPFSQADAAAAFAQGLYNNPVEVVVINGTLTIGVKKTEHIGCDWTVWDNFTVTRTGDVPELAKVENMTLSVAEGTVVEDDKIFPVVFGYTATLHETIAAMASGSISYTVTAEGKEPVQGTYDFDVAKDAQNMWIPGLDNETDYTVTINSVSVSYFDLETFESKVVFEQMFQDGELTVSFNTGVPVGINGVAAGAESDRKVRVDGKIVIIKNGQRSTVSGVTLK